MKFSYLRFFLILCCFLWGWRSSGQALSEVGRGHYNAALLLFESSSSVNDYLLVAEEFEAVLKTDPDYPNTYINLCKMYYRIGAEKGEPYFSKAETALSNYKRLAPGDTAGYTEETIALQAMRRKYDSNYQNIVKKKFVGTWRVHQGLFYIFRIAESGDALDVRVFTWQEKELETYDVSLNGGTLSFTVKDTDIVYVNGRPQRRVTETQGKSIINDKEVSYDYWKLTFDGERMIATDKWTNYYYLNGRLVNQVDGQFSEPYVKD